MTGKNLLSAIACRKCLTYCAIRKTLAVLQLLGGRQSLTGARFLQMGQFAALAVRRSVMTEQWYQNTAMFRSFISGSDVL